MGLRLRGPYPPLYSLGESGYKGTDRLIDWIPSFLHKMLNRLISFYCPDMMTVDILYLILSSKLVNLPVHHEPHPLLSSP